jgi:hypothetical protein
VRQSDELPKKTRFMPSGKPTLDVANPL